MIRKSGNRFSEKIMLKQKDTLESDSTWLNQTPAYPDRAVRGRVAGQQEMEPRSDSTGTEKALDFVICLRRASTASTD